MAREGALSGASLGKHRVRKRLGAAVGMPAMETPGNRVNQLTVEERRLVGTR